MVSPCLLIGTDKQVASRSGSVELGLRVKGRDGSTTTIRLEVQESPASLRRPPKKVVDPAVAVLAAIEAIVAKTKQV